MRWSVLGEYKAKEYALTNAAQLRREIETSLTHRIPSALSPRERVEPERASSGIGVLNDLLLGGIPIGGLSELVGPDSSGRTTAALSFLSGVTRSDQVAAWIDVADTFDPETAAANGVNLERLLWVRCGRGSTNVSAVAGEPATKGTRLPVSQGASVVPVHGGGGAHPRCEGQGMPEAISAMLQTPGGLRGTPVRRQKRYVGTPGAANRPLTFRSQDREEQVPSDRVPSRRAEQEMSARCAEPAHERRRGVVQREWSLGKEELPDAQKPRAKSLWNALDQSIQTADLLLQGGGFNVIVLDLGSIPAELVWRIPLATWFRFRSGCERTQVSLLMLTQHPCARSGAALVVRMASGTMEAQRKVMTGIAYYAETERQRYRNDTNVVSIRKQPQPEHGLGARWHGGVAWAAGR